MLESFDAALILQPAMEPGDAVTVAEDTEPEDSFIFAAYGGGERHV